MASSNQQVSPVNFERILARDVRPGDVIADARNHPAHEVKATQRNASSVWLNLAGGGRIRPGYGVKLWKLVPVDQPKAATHPNGKTAKAAKAQAAKATPKQTKTTAPKAAKSKATRGPDPAKLASAKVADYSDDQLARVPRIKRGGDVPTKGNYIVGQRVMRVCGSPFHEGDRHLPASAFYRDTKASHAGLPCDVCADCVRARGSAYSAARKAAAAQAAAKPTKTAAKPAAGRRTAEKPAAKAPKATRKTAARKAAK